MPSVSKSTDFVRHTNESLINFNDWIQNVSFSGIDFVFLHHWRNKNAGD